MHIPCALVIVFFSASAVLAGSDKTTLRKMWALSEYTDSPLPSVWRPAEIPATSSDVRDFERFSGSTNGLSVSHFVGRFGLPSRYLTTKRDGSQDFLIYDLPSGHSVALYVYDPTKDRFGACVIIASDGSLVKLIK